MTKNLFRQKRVSDAKRRKLVISSFLGVVGAIIARLWYLQILRGEDFSAASVRNRLREVIRPAPRGNLYDKQGKLLLANRNFFDLILIPQYVQDKEKTYA